MEYRVGGSLATSDPTYVERQADTTLYNALLNHEFCYVLTSRQMGKSSLRLRIKDRLQKAGRGCCASIDMSRIGNENITPSQWYQGIVFDLLRNFGLTHQIDLPSWWAKQGEISPLQKLSQFIETILFIYLPEDPIYIFIDEIDSVKGLNFPVDDFFTLIRFCYNQRAENLAYTRLTWVLFGAATPMDLIADPQRTPFNIGQSIDLSSFSWSEAQPLTQGLVDIGPNPGLGLQAILSWTGGQPFLTQKLCRLVVQAEERVGGVGEWGRVVERVVRSRIIENWEDQDEPEHLRTIRNRLLSEPQRSGRLLGFYQTLLNPATWRENSWADDINANRTWEQTELLLSGLIVNRQNRLQVANRIYATIFNPDWIEQALARQRPYSAAIAAWRTSNCQDESRLLRGQSLEEAQTWAVGKSLSDLDYQFLAASQALNQQAVQQALTVAEARNCILMTAQRQATRTIRRSQIIIAACSAVGIALLGMAGALAIQAAKQKQRATINEITSLNMAAEAFLNTDQPLNALLSSMRAALKLQAASWAQTSTTPVTQAMHLQTLETLQQMASEVKQQNSLADHTSSVRGVEFSPEGQLIATTSYDQTVKLWRPDGELLTTFTDHQGPVWSVSFSPNGQIIASASSDQTVLLWRPDGALLHTLNGHTDKVWGVAWSPDGNQIASVSADQTIRLWRPDGALIKILTGHTGEVWGITWSPDGRILASASADRTVRLWSREGVLLQTLTGHGAEVNSVSFSADGQKLASGSYDHTIRIWSRGGELLKTLTGHGEKVYSVRFSPDGDQLASSSLDKTIRLWRLEHSAGVSNGLEVFHDATLTGHTSQVFGLSFSPDGKTLASTGFDQTTKLWRLENPLRRTLVGHRESVRGVNFWPNGHILATAGWDATIKFWRLDGVLLKTLTGNLGQVYDVKISPDGDRIAAVSKNKLGWIWDSSGLLLATLRDHSDSLLSAAWSPDGQTLATTSADHTIKLWTRDGRLMKTITGHINEVWGVDWSPDGALLATASADQTIKLWTPNGVLRQTLVGHQATVSDVSFSPDGQILASSGWDQTINLWNRSGELLRTLTGHRDRVWSVSFSPDGQQLASASSDQTIKLWRRDGTPIITLVGHQDGVVDVSFSPDGALLASASLDKQLMLWNLEHLSGQLLDNLVNQGCSWIQDYLRTNPTVTKRDRILCQ